MPSPTSRLTLCAAAFVLSALAAAPWAPAADPPAARPALTGVAADISKLLETGWGDSIKALRPAEELFDEIAKAAPGDARAEWAWTLINLKHRRYTTADALVGELLARDPAGIGPRQARVWIQALNKKYSAALVEAETLVKKLPEPTAGETEADALEALTFIGRLYGFLEGPAGDASGKNLVVDHEKRMLALLSADRRNAFDAGRKQVADQFSGAALDAEQLRADEVAKEAAAKEEAKARLGQERASVSKEKETVDELASTATRDIQTEVAGLDKQLAPLNVTLARLSADASRLQGQVGSLELDIARALQRARDFPDDPVQQAIWIREADRLRFLQRQYNNDLNIVNQQGAQVNAQRLTLENQKRTAIARYEAEMKRLGKQAVVLAKTEKRITQDEKRTAGPATGNTSRVTSSSAKLGALSSYVEFPLDRARQRLLDELR